MVPQIVPFDFGEDDVNSGEMVSATCTVSKGDLPLKIEWYLNEYKVETIQGVMTNRVNKKLSTLSIESVDAAHSGKYSCVASNKAGNATYSSYLHVNGTNDHW